MKTDKNIQKNIMKYYGEIGLTIMALATMIGVIDIPEHTSRPAAAFIQPSKYSTFNQYSDNTNPLRREKEENATEYVSYSEAERTPSRSRKYEAT